MGPWVTDLGSPVKRSELTEGQEDMRKLTATVVSGEMEKNRKQYLREEYALENLYFDGFLSDEDLREKTNDVEVAFRNAFPSGSVYNAVDNEGKRTRLGLGKILGSGGTAVVCIVQDMQNLAMARNYAGKFFVLSLDSTAPQDMEQRENKLDVTWRMHQASNERLLNQASIDELLTNGIAVSQHDYTLESTHPQREKLPDVIVGKVGGKSRKRLLIKPHVSLMPLLGPSLSDFWSKAFTDNALKYLVFNLVTTVSYLERINLVHRDLKPANFAVDSNGRVFMIDLAFVANIGENVSCSGNLTLHYVDPIRAKCGANGGRGAKASSLMDSWSLGATIFSIICNGKKPFKFRTPRGRGDKGENTRAYYEEFLKKLKRENFAGGRCDFMTPERRKLLDIVKLLLDPQEETRWTALRLKNEHPFFQVEED
ncbi:unnamed protein product [Neospora caninum Liverpool]|nr:uncharacterized protein NCLIV_031550 [Neospora caninum Liverpool]CBZ53368.1 unnamed protein product [Neospora caninum Liverpool]|eukprot:XP_003883400.1 uncharacterized protein NCLIV_031550 [Neospora caninum Liverpool]